MESTILPRYLDMGPSLLFGYQTWNLPSSSDTRHGIYHPPQIPRHGTFPPLQIPDMESTILLRYQTWNLPSSSDTRHGIYHPPRIPDMGPSPFTSPVPMLLKSSGITVDLLKLVHLRTHPHHPQYCTDI